MTLDEILALAEEFDKTAQMVNPLDKPVPTAHVEKENKNREIHEIAKQVRGLAELIEKRYSGAKSVGFMGHFSTMRDLKKARSVLEDCAKDLATKV